MPLTKHGASYFKRTGLCWVLFTPRRTNIEMAFARATRLAAAAPRLGTRTFLFSRKPAGPSPLATAAERVKTGSAVVVDVREPSEWMDGVAEPAHLLSMSSLQSGSQKWNSFLEANKEKDILIYCKVGGRAGNVAQALKQYGFKTENLGGFSDWAGEGLPVRKPKPEELK